MVVFTCNHCGESLQKPRVEKHYATQCRRAKSLTCVDCFKDFKNEEYVVHTKCITEEERYAAKGSIPGGVVKKGDVKQESWTEMIRSIVENEKNLKPSLRNLFNTISTYTNVPRKKTKFINFLKSSTGGRVNFTDIESAWDLIEKYKDEQSKNVNTQNGDNVNSDPKENGTKDKLEDNEKVPAKKKKKDVIEAETNEGNEISKKKKKIKGEVADNTQNDHNVNTDLKENGTKHKLEDNEEVPAKKKKKKDVIEAETNEGNEISKKKKKIKGEVHDNNLNDHNVNSDLKENGPAKKKKKDVLKAETNEGDEISKKKKKIKGEVHDMMNDHNVNSDLEENGTKRKLEDNETVPATKKKDVIEADTNEGNEISKKKKKIKGEVNDNTQNGHNVNSDLKEIGTKHKLEDNEEVPAKKKKKGAVEAETNEDNNEISTKKKKVKEEPKKEVCKESDEVPLKKKKKTKKESQAETEQIKNRSNVFSFKETILNILRSKGSVSGKKLQKKVLKAYLKETGNAKYTRKTIKKYKQKLKELRNVVVKDDVVSLVTIP